MHFFSQQLAYNKPTDFTFQAKKTNFIKQAKKLTKIQENIQERNNKILELLLAGVPRKQIVEIMKISSAIVNDIAEKNQIFKKNITERTQRIIKKIQAGIPTAQIAKEENINITTVTRTAKKEEILTSKMQFLKEKKEAIKNDIKNGLPLKEVAKKYNIGEAYARKIKSELGLTKTYHPIPNPQGFKYSEIMEQARNISKLRKTYSKFRYGERTPEILDEMEKTLDDLKAKIQEFKSRFE